VLRNLFLKETPPSVVSFGMHLSEKCYSLKDMPDDPKSAAQLMDAAREAASHAYAPYSKFRVGAALLFDDGSVVTGCNVENMSYGLTSCAERNALFRAVSESGADRKIVAVAVTNLNGEASPPCGACRQVLSEFTAPHAVVSFAGKNGVESRPFKELLPFQFELGPH
jgi:cytidine deaminase